VSHDPPSPLAVFRLITGGALALATIALLVVLLDSGHLEWRLVALVLALWTAWGAGAEVYERVLEPAGRFLHAQIFGGGSITLADEIADLEHRLADDSLPADREILAAVRLAEIYRRYRADLPRAVALLDRLLLKYPESRELRIARGLQ
jgi:hypothetical protein